MNLKKLLNALDKITLLRYSDIAIYKKVFVIYLLGARAPERKQYDTNYNENTWKPI